MRGSRQRQVRELLRDLGETAQKCHDIAMKWRHTHVAHRQDRTRERVDVTAIVDPGERSIDAVRIRVSPSIGPEGDEEAFAATFQAHVKALRDLAWEKRIKPLEAAVLEESLPDIDALLAIAAPAPPPSKDPALVVDIKPSD